VKQYLANLELSPGATWTDVERAYARMLERYRPEKHAADPERHRAAQELTDSLTRAYQALQRYFGRTDG
jgi:curved DNA-binding protein CbpA